MRLCPMLRRARSQRPQRSRSRTRAGLYLLATFSLLSLLAAPARAAVVITLQEQGSDVVATASGTLNVADLSLTDFGNFSTGFINPDGGNIVLGSVGGVFSPYHGYTSITGPSSYGGGSLFKTPTSFSGDYVGVALGSQLRVPENYTSGTTISSTATWANTDFATLGVTPGDYVWSWGSGANADTLTLNASAVPEPSTWALAIGGLVCGGWSLARRRRRAHGPLLARTRQAFARRR